MNLRLAAYLSGTAYLVRVSHRPGGKRTVILDRTKRWRAAARAMKKAGRTEFEIVFALGRSREALARVTSFHFRF